MTDGFLSYQITEFGLAAFMEAKAMGEFSPRMLRIYAARYVAAHTCLSGTFWDAVNAVQEFIDLDQALKTAARLKRGFADTSQPGCHLQASLYWRGYHQVKDYLADQPDDLPILFTGKMGLDDIPLIKKLLEEDLLKLPERTPEQTLQLVKSVIQSSLKDE